ncbi:hypothetical protein Taro_005621 [Colocasia esculenta]|uniref:Uncharacterized protein n=1 Tax=Colocasia esculenta TaxID=4460 RepID=A0A843TV43_COLES|nr:hypothetical protein [Colocasia esculenta]
MAPKQLPRRGAKSRATVRPNPADEVPTTERRTKHRHDSAEQPGSSSAKRGRAYASGQGSVHPRRKTLASSSEASEKSTSSSSSSSSESSQPSRRPPSKPLSAGKTILKPRAVDLDDSELIAAFPENEKSEKIPKSNIYCFKHVQKFMGFRIVGDQVRRGPAAVEAPVAQEDQPPVQEEQPQAQEEQPPAPEDQPQVHEDQPPIHEDQPHVAAEVDEPSIAPLFPQLQPSSSMNLEPEIPSFSPPPPVQASSSFGGPSVPPELYTFLNDKFDALTTSIQSMSENFELRIQRLENSVSARFIDQKAASDHATQRFNRLIGTLADGSVDLKEHQEKLEIVLQGILANSQADVFNTQETLSQISKTRLSFAHLVDNLESMRNLSAHIDGEMSALKKEFKVLNRPGWSAGSSSSSQPMSNEFTAIQAAMDNIFCKGSVDTTILGVDTMVQNKGRNVKKSPSQVDTSPGQVDTRQQVDTRSSQVDTRDLSQGLVLPVWDSAQAPAPVPQEHGHGGPSIMERFKRMAPPSFKVESQPLLVES